MHSRRYRAVHRRHRNRFRDGISIYYLPPIAGLALSTYVLSASHASYDEYVDTFIAPPVLYPSRGYTVDDIIEDPYVRSHVRSVNLDIIGFDFGSAELSAAAIEKLEDLADAILEVIDQDPTQVFLIAGHTDAVGSFEKNLELSEERAANVQEILISEYGVPAENLEAVGYGEQYLRINTSGPERRNRRVVIRAIGSLLADRPAQDAN